MLAKCCGFKTEKCPRLVAYTMTPDVPATVPQRWGRNRFPYRPKIANRIRSATTIRMTITLLFPCIFHARYTAGSGFPHSRQNAFERDVINPQDGHILCDPKPGICGCFSLIKLADALKFLNERATKVGSVRKRGQNGRETGSIDEPSFLSVAQGPSRKA